MQRPRHSVDFYLDDVISTNLSEVAVQQRRRTQSEPSGGGPCIMRSVRRQSIQEAYEMTDDEQVPEVPHGGARVRVMFAGMTYTERQVEKKRLRLSGVLDTSLFPGFEVSGVVDEICSSVCESSDLQVGDRVTVYSDYNANSETGYAEFVTVDDLDDVIKLPIQLPLEVGSLLPSGALTAYSAVQRLKPHVLHKMESSSCPVNMLIVGAGGLALWSLRMAISYLSDQECDNKLRITIADTSIDGLTTAKQHGCFNVVHWNDALYEEHILERTRNACNGGVDVMLDFVTSQRTIARAKNVLKQDGVLLVGGISNCNVSSLLEQITQMDSTVLTLTQGTRDDLREVVNRIADGDIVPPIYSVFPMEEADQVFRRLSQSQIRGRVVLSVSSIEEETEPEDDFLTDDVMQLED